MLKHPYTTAGLISLAVGTIAAGIAVCPALLAIGFTVEVPAVMAFAPSPLAITFLGLAGGLIADAFKRKARDRANADPNSNNPNCSDAIRLLLEPLLGTT